MPGFNPNDYEPVEERLRKFWVDHPQGRIVTELIRYEDPLVIMRADVYRDEVCPVTSTGYAQETIGVGNVNKTSALENCETSAIGRALANLGYAPKGARPSREEMTKASGGAAAPTPPDSPSNDGVHAAVPAREAGAAQGGTPSFDQLSKAAGGRAKAREALNRVCGVNYSAATVGLATEEELVITLAALQEAKV